MSDTEEKTGNPNDVSGTPMTPGVNRFAFVYYDGWENRKVVLDDTDGKIAALNEQNVPSDDYFEALPEGTFVTEDGEAIDHVDGCMTCVMQIGVENPFIRVW